MLWDNNDPDFPRPQRYKCHTNLDYLLWERGSRMEPFEASIYCDSEDFLKRYGMLEKRYYPEMKKSADMSRRGVGSHRLYHRAFICLKNAWQEEDGIYYEEMEYPNNSEWFLRTLYWKIVSGFLKASNQFQCGGKNCYLYPHSSNGESLNVHHHTYEVEVGGEMIYLPGKEHLFLNKTLVPDDPKFPLLSVLCNECHSKVHGWQC